MCTFCKTRSETLYHILWECGDVQAYFKELVAYLKEEYNLTIVLTSESLVFPRVANESKLIILIITIAKQVIFKSKYKDELPNIYTFRSLLKTEAEKEKKQRIETKQFRQFSVKMGKTFEHC